MRRRAAVLLPLLLLLPAAGRAKSVAPPPVPPALARYAAEIAAAQACLDAFMAAFNERDVKAWEATFNFPHIRLASGTVTVLRRPGEQRADLFSRGALSDWDHSEWARRNVVQAGAEKVHIDTRFNRYRRDGTLIDGFDSIYVVTKANGHWGVQARSSFAP